MKILALVCRILLGVAFVVFGANIIHDFMHMPMPPADTPMAQWGMVMHTSGWMTAVGVFQVLGGLLVLAGGTLPLGLCILCPITVNILLCHITLMGGKGIGAGLFVTVLELVLIYAYRGSFAGILSATNTPTPAPLD